MTSSTVTRPALSIIRVRSDAEIDATRATMLELRPHLDPARYRETVRSLMTSDAYELVAALRGATVVAVAGYRILTMLYCGKLLHVDDLVTDPRYRSEGAGRALVSWLKQEAGALGCKEIHLDTRVQRDRTHRFYFREGLAITCFHFAGPVYDDEVDTRVGGRPE